MLDQPARPNLDDLTAEHQQARAAYLALALRSGDGFFAGDALGAIVCAYGLDAVAAKIDVAPETLIEMFDANRTMDIVTFMRLARAVGITLCAE